MSFLIDTDVAIHLRDLNDAMLLRLEELGKPPNISVITLVELEGGIYSRPELTRWRRSRIDAMLTEMAIVPFDADCATAYGRIVAHAGFTRRKINDRMIAATALVHSLTLITINGDDFRDVPGLKLDVWA